MENSANLSLPYILGSQAQKHVTHNESLDILDCVVQLAVLDRDLAAPPASPAEGARYIVAASASGDWAGQGDKVALWRDGAWSFLTPRPGWLALVLDEPTGLYWSGTNWADLSGAFPILQNLALLGVGTTADAVNPFAAKLNKALWTARTAAEGGDGDLRYTLNKEGGADVLSLLMQSGFSGRAELGLIGDDNLRLKVSPDGASWTDAVVVDAATGKVSAAGLAATTDIQVFTASGTWTKPVNAKLVHVTCVGAGGGGGGGPTIAASTAASGGGGGGGGARLTDVFAASDLPSTVSVTIGAGGAGGAGATALGDGANGAGAGGDSIFGPSMTAAYLAARGGGAGAGGGSGRASGGGGGGGRNFPGGGASGATGGSAGLGGGASGGAGGSTPGPQTNNFGGGGGGTSSATGVASSGGAAGHPGTGGGAGGGFDATNTVRDGGAAPLAFASGPQSATAGLAPGGNGDSGGGGASTVSGNGGAGAPGSTPGRGGGGGGASQSGNGGNGGAGGPGRVVVVTYF